MSDSLPYMYDSARKNWLFLLSLVVLVVVVVVAVLPIQSEVLQETSAVSEEVVERPPLPVIKEGVQAVEFSAQAMYAQDLESGRVLFTKNADFPLLPASTTKIATAVVAFEYYDLGQVLTVPSLGISGKTMGLVVGERITVRSLLYGLLVYSANDAAEVLARSYPGGRANFVDAMNRLGDKVGLEKTNFTNPTGFDEYLHFSTARDLVKLSKYALQMPELAEIVATEEVTVSSVDGGIRHRLTNINKLLGRVDGVKGVKTGWTENAGESLVTLVERDGHRVLISVLGSHDRFGETEKLIEWIFDSYVWE